MNLSLQQIFGVSAIQDINTITFQKASIGITPQVINTPESILAGLLITASNTLRGSLTDIDGNNISDIQGNIITYNQQPLYPLVDVFLWRVRYDKGFKIHQFVILDNNFDVD